MRKKEERQKAKGKRLKAEGVGSVGGESVKSEK
jgi:hypothetical protein